MCSPEHCYRKSFFEGLLGQENQRGNTYPTGYQEEFAGGRLQGKALAQRAQKVETITSLTLGEPLCPLTHYIEKEGNLLSIGRPMDTERPPQQGVIAIPAAHHHKLPWLSCPADLRGFQPEEMSPGYDLCVGYDRGGNLFHFLRYSLMVWTLKACLPLTRASTATRAVSREVKQGVRFSAAARRMA